MDLADSDDYYEVFTILNDASGILPLSIMKVVTSYFGGYKLIGI